MKSFNSVAYGLVSYLQIHILVILFLTAWLLWERFLSKDENTKAGSYRYIVGLYVSIIIAEIANCAWAVCDYKWQSYHVIMDIFNVVYFISLTAMLPCWLYYQCAFGRGRLCSTRTRRIVLAIPYFLFVAAVLLSPRFHIIFYTDAMGVYHKGNYYWLYFAITGFYFILALLASLYRFMHAGSYIEEKLNLVLMSMPATFLFFLTLRLLFMSVNFLGIAVTLSIGIFYFLKNRYKLIDFINDDYLAVFLVNVDKLTMKTIIASDEYVKMVYCPLSVEFPFENALEGIRNHVVDDDRFMVEKEYDPEAIYLRLKGDKSFSMIYRVRTNYDNILFFQNKFIAARTNRDGQRYFLLCVKNIENEIDNNNNGLFDRYSAEQKEFERKRELYNVIAIIAGHYDVIANVDLDTLNMSFYQQSLFFKKSMEKIPPSKRGYKDCLHIFVKNQIVPDDQRRYLKKMNISNVLAELEKRNSVMCRFRMIGSDGMHLWYETKIIRNSVRNIMMTIRNIEEEVRQEVVYRKEKATREANDVIDGLARDFSCVLLVDPVTMENITFSKEEKYAEQINEWQDDFDFETRLVLLRTKYVIPEDREQFARATQKDVILTYLKDHNSYFVNYRAMIMDKLENWQIKFVMVSSGDVKKLVVGFHNIDNEISLENQRYAVVSELTKDYLFIDYVAIPDGTNDEDYIKHYQIDEDFKSSLPEWEKSESGASKLALLRDYFVITEDRKGFAENVDYKKIVEYLQTNSTFTYAFRAVVKGKVTHCQIKYIAYRDRLTNKLKGTVIGVRSIEAEVSKELKHIAEMEKAREAAESASRSKSSFLFNMSHDMRTPMNAILGFTELAKNALDDKEKINDYLDNIGIAGEHLLNLINDILDMARIESGKVSLTENEIDIAANADDLYSIIKKSAESKRIDFSVDHTGIKNRRVFVDKMHLNQVVLNLISNSIKYTPDGGKVSYSITEAPAEKAGYSVYEMTVADTGMGMDAKFMATLFEPFTRSEDAVKSGAQGTGLGMAITKHLIEQMNGSIKVDSEVGKGTTAKVSFTLRLADQQKDVAKEAEANAGTNSDMDLLRGKRVLLVDDNKLNQKLATAVLNIGKLVVEVASNGGEALDKVKSHEPEYYDFILMDVQMPQMDGYETTKAIRSLTEADYSHVPIVAMTANAFEEDKMKAFAAGMNSHVAKPIDVKKLFSVLCGFIKGKNNDAA